MTTIAANREMMAADSQGSTEDGLITSHTERKLRRLGEDLVACQGDDDAITLFEEWYVAGQNADEKPDIAEEFFGALVLTGEGRLFRYYRTCVPVEIHEDFYAMGSGQEIAWGALAAGATPEEAVKIACRLNVWTGPPVVVERI